MKKLFLPFILLSLSGYSQKYVSVVEHFCNTGDADAVLSIPSFNNEVFIADTNDLNHIYIQYHIDQTFGDWTDEFVTQKSNERYAYYNTLGIVNNDCEVIKNGAVHTDSPWYNSNPDEKYIYSSGAKAVHLIYEDYDVGNQVLTTRFHLGKKYLTGDQVSVHIFLLEDNLSVSVTGGENSGEQFTLNHVARAQRTVPAIVYADTVQIQLPAGVNIENCKVVAIVQDDVTGEVLGGTRGIQLEPYINAPQSEFSVVECFVNTGCYGGPSAISSMYNFAQDAETNNENQALVQLHIGQTYGNWSDIYKLPTNALRYDKYCWDLGILAGLAAVSKNGIRYKPDSWNDCEPLAKKDISFMDIEFQSKTDSTITVAYNLSGHFNPHDKVYFYLVESDIEVYVTGGEIPGTTLNMNNVARTVRVKSPQQLSDTVTLSIPSDAILNNCRILGYVQNDVTYDITGGTKGFKVSEDLSFESAAQTIGFQIYPNPSNGEELFISLNKALEEPVTIELYDALGQKIFTEKVNEGSSACLFQNLNLISGTYLVVLASKNARTIEKWMVH